MAEINWMEEVQKRKEQLLADTIGLLKIKSVLDEEHATEDAPLGIGVRDALLYMLSKGDKSGFTTKNLDNLAGHIEFGSGEELIGVLCHVDVVPEGDGWSTDPYSGEIKDGKIFARGALDDKGPTMAAFYAVKILKELGLSLSKRVRIIIGTDEESNWRCVKHYFEHEEMPSSGFAPDADFPIINAEKGISSMDLLYKKENNSIAEAAYIVESFTAGRRYNMVPDYADAVLATNLAEINGLKEQFQQYIQSHQLQGRIEEVNGKIQLAVEGISAHAMEPDNGKNAGIYLAAFLSNQKLDKASKGYFTFINETFFGDTRGKNLQVAYADDISGELTVNAAIFSYHSKEGGKIGINFRYPVTFNMEKGKETIEKLVQTKGFTIGSFSDSKPHHVDKNNPLIKTLQKVYEEQTGEKAELLSIGGGTYARSLTSGVAFGPLFPGKPDVAHQKDEYIEIADLLKATAIYAQAIYELGK
ncbi:dipeptidase PepV [Caldibacillus lycopersici]|uniref:Dipeptidase PepV n=1 Tax=Perspicuibacillus lycopersici TaxID=1325689 RepID=A0AAE3ITS8_9BACI|nr:dipeptidase PepV [Perspicuibacillus lycopersici]MCU9614257.1 dipeptidase PepV [Perspicuibacillus lycopersici]